MSAAATSIARTKRLMVTPLRERDTRLSTLAELLAGCALRKVGHVLVVLVCLIGEADAGEGVIGEVLESVAAAFEGVDVGVVDDAVDHGGGDGLVAEDLSPAGEG